MNKDVYTRITDKIVAELEQGVHPWMNPWNGEHAAGKITRPLRHNGTPYSGMNIIMLWMEAEEKGYNAPIWMTYKQTRELDGHVLKGEKGSLVVYANTFKKTETDKDTGETIDRDIPFMKGYTVFNVKQTEGLPDHYYATVVEPKPEISKRDPRIESFFTDTGADIRHGGNKAYYTIGPDYIRMPPYPFFKDAESYYATLAHETTHWTRHPSRLDRNMGRKKWGDEGYAMEELVAEIGSAFLSVDLGITPEVRDDHAAYIDGWLKVLKNDTRAIFTAAAYAQKAADYLHSLQPAPDSKPEPKTDTHPSQDFTVKNDDDTEPSPDV